jgi:hypothetical protein
VPVKATNKFFQLVLPEPVWTVATTTSDQFSPTTRAPFRIKLPEDMAPSVADGGKSREVNVASLSAKIEYTVVVQGTRRGFFRLGRWVEKTVSIVKSAASEDVHTKVTLATGPWTGSWRVLSAQTVVSTGGTVRAEVSRSRLHLRRLRGLTYTAVDYPQPLFVSFGSATGLPASDHHSV